MAREENLPACPLGRIILKGWIVANDPGRLPFQETILLAIAVAGLKEKCRHYFKNLDTIENEGLRANIKTCVKADDLYSPEMDVYKQ